MEWLLKTKPSHYYLVGVLFIFVTASAFGYTVKERGNEFDDFVFSKPEIRVTHVITKLDAVKSKLNNVQAYDRLLADLGPSWWITVDERSGMLNLLEGGALPWIQGVGNDLRWESLGFPCFDNSCIPVEVVEKKALLFLEQYHDVFGLDDFELIVSEGSGPYGNSLYMFRFHLLYHGIPIQGANIDFRINNGNLIQVGITKAGPIDLDPNPTLSVSAAWEILTNYLGQDLQETDRFVDEGSLHIIPVTPWGHDPNFFDGVVGSGLTYALIYQLRFERSGVIGVWEAIIDAHTGEILRFVDANRYGSIHGYVYPVDNHTGEVSLPLPFADTGLAAPDDFADVGGNFPDLNATTTLMGKYTWISDSCGMISNTTTTGDVDFMGSPAETDCQVPVGNTGGPGNTMSARTLYWNATMINIKGRVYFPGNTWLETGHITINANGSPLCNATSGVGTINFYQSDTGCWNLGEIPSVCLHEWGHSWDDYDGSGGDSPPVETRADFHATFQNHDSCNGRGIFLSGNCSGYGDACLNCSGIRDSDYTQHASATPWTAANHGTFWSCSGGSYFGPCGLEDHCESGISSQALWEFVNTDLIGPPTNMDINSAWVLADRLFWLSHSQLGDMYNSTPPNSDGCNADGLYELFKAIDDDGDGTANGTPHAAAIFSALDRNNIACGLATDPTNQNQTSCPSLAIGILNGSAGSNSVSLSWDAVTNATRYKIIKNQLDCDSGFAEIAEIAAPTLNYTDNNCVNGIRYYYRYQALTANDACASATSNCVAVMPQRCDGELTLDDTMYTCSDTISISVLDGDLTGNGVQDVTVWSDSEMTPEIITLIETPPSSSMFMGTIDTTSSTSSGDGMIGVVDSNTITVRYIDLDYCGTPNVNVDSAVTADCTEPIITNVQSSVNGINVTITWDTNELSDSVLYYGTTPPAWTNVSSATMVTNHSMSLSDLLTCTMYYFWVESTDSATNTAFDDNGGIFYTFSTGLEIYEIDETFESFFPPADWIVINNGTGGLWERNDDLGQLNQTTSIGGSGYCAASGLNGTSGTTWDTELWLPAMNLELYTSVTLYYSSNFQDYNGNGEIWLDVSTNGGTNWTTLRNQTEDDPAEGTFETVDLTPYISENAVVKWRYQASTSSSWYLHIDNVQVIGVLPCPISAGTIDLDRTEYGCLGDMIKITVSDADVTGSVNAEITSTAGDIETVACLEGTSNVFVQTIDTAFGTVNAGDSILQVNHSDTLTATYYDADDGTGNPATVQDTATIDCQGPIITNLQHINVWGISADILWDTDEIADSLVIYEDVLPPAANSEYNSTLELNHTLNLIGLTECTQYYYSVQSVDIYGNTSIDDNGGSYYSFTTGIDVQPTYTSMYPELIYDFMTRTSTITVPELRFVQDVEVTIELHHTNCSNLDIYLVTPDSTRIELTTDNGGDGDHFLETRFDDEASTPITSGTPPFTGSYQPEGLLADADGIIASGDWVLEITDDASGDEGVLSEWNLHLTFQLQSCDPHALYNSHALVQDTCFQLGPGDDDGIWDAGEDVQFSVTIYSDGTEPISGISALITPLTPGIVMLNGTANFNDLPADSTGVSLSPHFEVSLPETLNCGDPVDFQIDITTNEGNWSNTFSQTVGLTISGNVIAIDEDFGGTFPPAGWTVVNNNGNDWDRNDNLGQGNQTPSSGYCAASGSNGATGTAWDTELWSPSIDLSTAQVAQLTYASNFQDFAGNGDIYLDISTNGGLDWTNLRTQTIDDPVGGTFETEDLSAFIGNSLILRWHYVASSGESWFWHIDKVILDYTLSPDCVMNTCSSTCMLTVEVLPDSISQVCEGQSITFETPPTGGVGPFTYQWTEDGVDIGGATDSTYTATYGTAQSHTYNCKVTDSSGVCFDIMDPADSTGEWIPCCTMTVDVTPTKKTVCEGVDIMYTATPIGGTGPFSYQWTEDDIDIGGATNSTYITHFETVQSHTYNCKVTDSGICNDIKDNRNSTGNWIICLLPPPAGDGITGAGIQLSKISGDTIHVDYDVTTCNSHHAVVVYGTIGDFNIYTGAVTNCDVGNNGDADFDIAGSNVWFNLVWVNLAGIGGHPGFASSGERNLDANGYCDVVVDDHSDILCD